MAVEDLDQGMQQKDLGGTETQVLHCFFCCAASSIALFVFNFCSVHFCLWTEQIMVWFDGLFARVVQARWSWEQPMNAFLKFPYQRKKPEWTEYGVELGADIFTEAEEKFGTQVTYVVVLTVQSGTGNELSASASEPSENQ